MQYSIFHSPQFCELREYPKGLGKSFLKIFSDLKVQEHPKPCLRQKYDYSHIQSEKELFDSLPIGDTWPDAMLSECYFYLYKNKSLRVPDEWASTMRLFTEELKLVTGYI